MEHSRHADQRFPDTPSAARASDCASFWSDVASFAPGQRANRRNAVAPSFVAGGDAAASMNDGNHSIRRQTMVAPRAFPQPFHQAVRCIPGRRIDRRDDDSDITPIRSSMASDTRMGQTRRA
jgi:hypothetical protein